jgi:hypothetical protein
LEKARHVLDTKMAANLLDEVDKSNLAPDVVSVLEG